VILQLATQSVTDFIKNSCSAFNEEAMDRRSDKPSAVYLCYDIYKINKIVAFLMYNILPQRLGNPLKGKYRPNKIKNLTFNF